MIARFTDMPSWTIVAVMARIARHVQGLVEGRPHEHRKTVDDAIQVAEESALNALADPRAAGLADRARGVSEDAIRSGDTGADVAALCASEAAAAVRSATERQDLLRGLERSLEHLRRLGRPEGDRIVLDDIAQFAELASGLGDNDPAPPAPAGLDLVYRQAIHEAGHAVAACRLVIQFDAVSIVPYKAEGQLACNPRDHKLQLGYAAGAAAEDLVFGGRQDWGCAQDRRCHEDCGGADFDSDVAEVRRQGWFRERDVLTVASLLKERRTLLDRDIQQALKGLEDG